MINLITFMIIGLWCSAWQVCFQTAAKTYWQFSAHTNQPALYVLWLALYQYKTIQYIICEMSTYINNYPYTCIHFSIQWCYKPFSITTIMILLKEWHQGKNTQILNIHKIAQILVGCILDKLCIFLATLYSTAIIT